MELTLHKINEFERATDNSESDEAGYSDVQSTELYNFQWTGNIISYIPILWSFGDTKYWQSETDRMLFCSALSELEASLL